MKSLWFFLFVCMSSQAFAQVQEFEDYMSLYHLNQSDVEDRLGCSYDMYIFKERNNAVTEQYTRNVRIKKIMRQDSWWGVLGGDGLKYSLKTNALRGDKKIYRSRPNGQMLITDLPATKPGVIETLYDSRNPQEVFRSPFEIGFVSPPESISGGPIGETMYQNLKCVKAEENGCVVWWNLLTYRHACIKITFDKDVEYLPRSVLGIRATSDFDVQKFNGEMPGWEKMKWFKSEYKWQKLESDEVYVPKHIKTEIVLEGEGGKYSIDIHYTNWKVGDAVDKTLLDEEKFKKFEVRSFPFDELIKAFPDNPPAIVK